MPRKPNWERIQCEYFAWLVGKRGDVYQADGRSNRPSAGRHSLGTRDRDEALAEIKRLDGMIARRLGLALPATPEPAPPNELSLKKGRELYEAYIGRPELMGGARKSTQKRYKPVFDRFVKFAQGRGVYSWNGVTRALLQVYGAVREPECEYRTLYLELTTIKQAIKWLIDEKHLPESCRFKLPLRKVTESSTYCWKEPEVAAMVQWCRERPELTWLGNVIMVLAHTGLRIGELVGLCWPDLNFETGMIVLRDETGKAKVKRRLLRQTKTGRSRTLPIHPDLRQLLDELPRSKDGRVLHGPRGGKLKPDTVRVAFVRNVVGPIAAKLGIQPSDTVGFLSGRLHSFRHYFCSQCARQRVPMQTLMDWLGQKSAKMVQYYYHLHDEESRRQMGEIRFLTAVPGHGEHHDGDGEHDDGFRDHHDDGGDHHHDDGGEQHNGGGEHCGDHADGGERRDENTDGD